MSKPNLDDPVLRRRAAMSIVRDASRGDDGDPFAELNPLDVKFFRYARVALHVPIVDPVETRQTLMFLIDHLPRLVAEMDRTKERRSKSLLVHSTLKAWNNTFHRRFFKKKGAQP